jgi:hypothetical protein
VVSSGGTIPGGTAASADNCWCPGGTVGSWSWGAAVTCGTACAGGTLAGKFVSITGTRAFTAILSSYGLIGNRSLHQSVIVQTQ